VWLAAAGWRARGSSRPTLADASRAARSKFWYFLRKLKKVKKANGQIVAVNEIFEADPTTVKNYGIWIRYQSRTGFHNMYKEYRDVTLNGAVQMMYEEMGGRHRVRAPCLQIIKTALVPDENCKRDNTRQFHGDDVSFPLTHKVIRPSSKALRSTFKYVRPSTAM